MGRDGGLDRGHGSRSRSRDKRDRSRSRGRRSPSIDRHRRSRSRSRDRRLSHADRRGSPVPHGKEDRNGRGGRHGRDTYESRHGSRHESRHDPSHDHHRGPAHDRHDSRDDRHRQRHSRSRSPLPAAANPPPPRGPDMHMQRAAQPPLSDAPPAPGTIHKGVVHTIKHFGIFVSIPGYRRHVLVHVTQVADDIKFNKDDDNDTRVKAMDFFFPKGTEVWVKITAVEPDERSGEVKVNGSMRAVSQEDGTDLDPSGRLAAGPGPQSDEPPEEGSVHKATVKRIEAYGVFVQLEGFRKHGLVHSSQVSNYLSFSREDSDVDKKAQLSGVVSIGDVVYVKVVEVTDDESGRGPKIGCSIKLVEQGSGEDLDPNGLRYKPRGEGGGGRPGGAGPLGADAGTIKGGKIDWGHLAGDNRLYVGDHKGEYSLIEDEKPSRGPGRQELPPPPPGPPLPGPPLPGPPPGPRTVEEALAIIEQYSKSKKGKKEKKKKKEKDKSKSKKHKSKKHKKSKDHGSPSESDDSGSDPLLDAD